MKVRLHAIHVNQPLALGCHMGQNGNPALLEPRACWRHPLVGGTGVWIHPSLVSLPEPSLAVRPLTHVSTIG